MTPVSRTRSRIALLLAGCLVVSTTARAAIDLPSMGEPADQALSPLEESKLGASVMRQLRRGGYVLDDPQLAEYLMATGRRLAAHSGANPSGFEFFFIRDNRINAFALPGGYIGINAGLLLTTQNESELAGVLAHEIAHVTQRHIARQIEATQALNLATMAALLVALIASGGSGDLAQAALTLGISGIQQRQINFTRSHELEADRVGIRILANAGYDPNGMASFFQRMEEQTRLYGDALPEILRTHPVNITRITEARSRAAGYAPVSPADEREYRLMQARLRVLSSAQVTDALVYFQGRTQEGGGIEADRYGLGLALLRAGRPEAARELFEALLKEQPDQPHFRLELARAQLAGQSPRQALETLEQAHTRFPRSLPIAATYAEALLRFNRPADARRVILAADGALGGSLPDMHRLLAVSAQDLGWKAEALFRMAEYHHLQGDYNAAMNQLEAALRLPDINPNDKARVSAQLETYRREAPTEAANPR
ncbi:MAG TPA: M48 family metalloprotease [Nevskiales bacterium]|nr:M48 family metalloprotease [Nevskiales bacterium]